MEYHIYQGEHEDCGEVCQPADVETVDDIREDNEGRPYHCRDNIDDQ